MFSPPRLYPTDLTDAEWQMLEPLIPATNLFLHVGDAATTLIALGVIGHPTRPQLTYPGAAAALAAAGDIGKMVIQRSPNNANSSITPSAANVLGERS